MSVGPKPPEGSSGQRGPADGLASGTRGTQHNQARFLKVHGRYILGVALLLAVLAWLTFDQVHPDIPLLLLVVLIAFLYRYFATSSHFTERARTNLVFMSLGFGLVALLGVLVGWNVSHLVFVLTPVLVYAIFALGLNLEFGYTGIINFGHVAFMGIGAYTMAILSVPLIEHAEVLTEPTPATLVGLLAMALIAFLVAGIFTSVLAEVVLNSPRGSRIVARRLTGPVEDHPAGVPATTRRRITFVAGLVSGLLAALGVVWVVPYPMTPVWAQAAIILGGVLAGMVLAAFAGVLLGIPTLRLRADYLAIVTIGAAEILRRFFRNEAWLTGGPAGIPQVPRPFSLADRDWAWLEHAAAALGVTEYRLLLFLMTSAGLLFVLGVYAILLRAPYGRVLRAIREDEDVAAALGKDVFRYKLQVLAIGSSVAALSGAFLAWHLVFVSPNSFLPLITFYAWIIIVIGGVGNNKGAVLGAIILISFFEITRALNLDTNLGLTSGQGAALRVVLIGVLLILLMMFKPEGLLGKREELVLGD